MEMPRLEHKRVGSQFVVTSPDVPELFVAHSDLQTAYDAVPSALAMLKRMEERRAEREHVNQRVAACA